MLPQTHRVISSFLYDKIQENTDIKLSKKRLVLGSTAPDFLPKYKIKRHYMEYSLDFVIDMIYILAYDYSNNNIRVSNFSYRLGIITHYLSDFFCVAHNDIYFRENLYAHFIYEKNIHSYFVNFYDKIYQSIDRVYFSDKNSVKYLINSFHDDYCYEKPSYQNDAFFTLSMISSISIALIQSKSLEKSYETGFAAIF